MCAGESLHHNISRRLQVLHVAVVGTPACAVNGGHVGGDGDEASYCLQDV
jgi:hypothetical protein